MRSLLIFLFILLPLQSMATIIGYFPNWAAYRDESTLLTTQTRELDILVYSSTRVVESGNLEVVDSFTDLEVEQVSQSGEIIKGNFAAVAKLKEQQPDLKVMISVGGWSHSKHISNVLADPQKMQNLLTSWQGLVDQYGFDGLELDWQYPISGGALDNSNNKQDLENLLGFAKAYKAQCSQCILSVTLGAGSHVRKGWPFLQLKNHIDWFILHASAFNGSWSNSTGHISPLFATQQQPRLSIDSAVQQLLNSGLPNEQLILQVSTIGTMWQGVANINNGLYQSASKEKPFGTWDNAHTGATGNVAYREIIDKDLQWQKLWDEQARVSALYNAQNQQFISYESIRSLNEKLAYIERLQLGGIGFWDIEGDSKQGLINAAYRYWQPWLGFYLRLQDHLNFFKLYYLSAFLILLSIYFSRYYWQRYQKSRIEKIFHQQWHIWLQQIPQQLSSLAYLTLDAKPNALEIPDAIVEGAQRLSNQLDSMIDDPWQRLDSLIDDLVAPWQPEELANQLKSFLSEDQRISGAEVLEKGELTSLTLQQFKLDLGDEKVLVVQCSQPLDEEITRYLRQLKSMVKVARVNAGRLLAQPQLLNELSKIACRRDKIQFIKAENGYSGIYADDLKRPEFVLTRLRFLAIHFPNLFISPHRSYLVVKERVEGAIKIGGKYYLVVAGQNIPIARGQLKELKQANPGWFVQKTSQAA